jgi:hypothetical protein
MRKRDLEKIAIRELKKWVRVWRAKYVTAPRAANGFAEEAALFRVAERLIERDNVGRVAARRR